MSAARAAVDWGTSKLRAWLLDEAGTVLDRVSTDDGIMAVPPGGFPATLDRVLAPWPGVPVLMAGMVGSQNGWREAPYLSCPATAADLAAGVLRIGNAVIVPGLRTADAAGMPDVMRGEEVKALGSGLRDGIVVTPGTHSKWITVQGGAITGFTTYMTGDLFAAVGEHTILARLRAEPPDPAGFERGLALAAQGGGLTHQLFAARTLVLAGQMPGDQVGPFLSGLLIGTEVAQALADAPAGPIMLVAEGTVADGYRTALGARTCEVMAPDHAFLSGLGTIARLLP